jgi:hypothetical protein
LMGCGSRKEWGGRNGETKGVCKPWKLGQA